MMSAEVPLADLFSQDPLELTDEDISRIVAYFRERRATFTAEVSAGRRAPTQGRLLAPKTLSLDDLDL